MLIEEINVAEWFNAKTPSLARCKEGDLPLLNFPTPTTFRQVTLSLGLSKKGSAAQLPSIHDLTRYYSMRTVNLNQQLQRKQE